MDQARVEQLGAKAIEPELNNLKDVKTRDYFTALMGRTTTDFEFSLFTLMIYPDLKDPHRSGRNALKSRCCAWSNWRPRFRERAGAGSANQIAAAYDRFWR